MANPAHIHTLSHAHTHTHAHIHTHCNIAEEVLWAPEL